MVSVIPIDRDEQICRVCREPAYVECLLYAVYLETPDVILERDETCPFLCLDHFLENEEKAFSKVDKDELRVTVEQIAEQYRNGERRMSLALRKSVPGEPQTHTVSEILATQQVPVPAMRDDRGRVYYPHTNRGYRKGYSIYRRLFLPKTEVETGNDD
jgi:hypothetical protein